MNGYKRFLGTASEEPTESEIQSPSAAKAAKVAKAVTYEQVAQGDLVSHYTACVGWLLEHRPDLHAAVKAADQGPGRTDASVLEAALRAGVEAFEAARRCDKRDIEQELFS